MILINGENRKEDVWMELNDSLASSCSPCILSHDVPTSHSFQRKHTFHFFAFHVGYIISTHESNIVQCVVSKNDSLVLLVQGWRLHVNNTLPDSGS